LAQRKIADFLQLNPTGLNWTKTRMVRIFIYDCYK